MTRRLHRSAALLGVAVLTSAMVPAAVAATAHRGTMGRAAAADAPSAAVAPAKLALGTVKGRIKSAHRLARVDIVLYQRETATDGSKGWVASDDQFANNGYGLTLNKKTGDYSFRVKPGTYRLEYNGAYGSGHEWGIVAYGSGKVSAAAFGKSVTVRKGKVTEHINTQAAGDFAGLPAPDPAPRISPNTPTAGGAETVLLGTWPRGTRFTYTWQINNSQKYLSFKRSVTVPHSAGGKPIGVDIYAHVYGKNGYGVSIGTGVSK
jgi:hypothetical protein